MLELSIVCVIATAALYWMALWLMGRREDVLYGSFVTPVSSAVEALPQPSRPEWPPELPRRPRVRATAPAPAESLAPGLRPAAAAATISPDSPASAIRRPQPSPPPASMTWPAVSPGLHRANTLTAAALPRAALSVARRTAVPAAPRAVKPGIVRRALPAAHTPPRTDILASLLETIKRDLSEASRG